MTPPINSVSDHILDGIASGDLAASPFEVVSIAKELAARRAANTPVSDDAEEAKLVAYFRGEGLVPFGIDGDYEGRSPAETAIHAMKELVELRKAIVEKFIDATIASPALPSQVVDDEDLASDERWNEGVNYAIKQLCELLGIDWRAINWDAATETLDGDVRSVIGNAMVAAYGEEWSSDAETTARIQSCLTSPAAEPGPGEDKLDRLIDFIIGPSASDADFDADAEKDQAKYEGRYTDADELRDLQQSIMQCRTLEDLRAVQITVQHIRTHPAPSASREVTVTDEMVLRSCQSEYPALFRHGLTPPEGSGLNSRKQMETIIERHRSALNAALLAALPEREGE